VKLVVSGAVFARSILAVSAFVCLWCDPAAVGRTLGKRLAAIHRTVREFGILVRTIFQADPVPLTATHCVGIDHRAEDDDKSNHWQKNRDAHDKAPQAIKTINQPTKVNGHAAQFPRIAVFARASSENT
jgi:hypothetical protein